MLHGFTALRDAFDASCLSSAIEVGFGLRGMGGEEHAFRPRQRRAPLVVLHVELRALLNQVPMISSEPRLAAPCSAVSPIEFTALTSMPSS